jgi:Uma2 family endonuclease
LGYSWDRAGVEKATMATGHDANIDSGDFHVTGGRAMSADEFFTFSGDGRRLELIAGEVRDFSEPHRRELISGVVTEMSPSGFDHGVLIIQIGSRLNDFVAKRGSGKICGGDVGFVVARNPDTVLAPDIAFVSGERIPESGCSRFFDGAPDLAIEIVSPWDRASEVEAKARHWIGCGSRLVWVVDGVKQSVTVYVAGGERRTITIENQLDGGDVLPGFTATLREIFEC